jgi:hypothetical protein
MTPPDELPELTDVAINMEAGACCIFQLLYKPLRGKVSYE